MSIIGHICAMFEEPAMRAEQPKRPLAIGDVVRFTGYDMLDAGDDVHVASRRTIIGVIEQLNHTHASLRTADRKLFVAEIAWLVRVETTGRAA